MTKLKRTSIACYSMFALCVVLRLADARAVAAAEGSLGAAMPVRGVVRSVRQASISTDLPARISRLPYREAELFKQGDVLAVFDCERIRSESAAATATSREMRLTWESQAYLERRGAVGKLDVDIARARFDRAEAEAGALAARVKQCEIIAPFDGRIAELKINAHELPNAGVPFMSIVGEADFEIDLIVPSSSLRSLHTGAAFTFTVDETMRSYRAEVLRIGASVDPVSQSVKVIARFIDVDERIISGMSGTALWPHAETGP